MKPRGNCARRGVTTSRGRRPRSGSAKSAGIVGGAAAIGVVSKCGMKRARNISITKESEGDMYRNREASSCWLSSARIGEYHRQIAAARPHRLVSDVGRNSRRELADDKTEGSEGSSACRPSWPARLPSYACLERRGDFLARSGGPNRSGIIIRSDARSSAHR